MTVIEFARKRMANEEHEARLGADNRHILSYWAAYLDGASEQKEEDEKAAEKERREAPVKEFIAQGLSMNLWQLLDVFVCYQEVHVYKTNDYDENVPVFHGKVDDARHSEGCWDCLLLPVRVLEIKDSALIVKVDAENYETPCEELYFEDYVQSWDRLNPKTRPYRFSCEIDADIEDWRSKQ